MTTTILLLLTVAAVDTWGPASVVSHDDKPCVTYRAQVAGGYLLVDVKLEPGWHTFAMDNDKRASAKLAGKKALALDKPTHVLPEGFEISGPWRQPEPKDFSQPELRIFSWGFEGEALLVAPVKASTTGRVRVTGQACTQSVCKNIDLVVQAPLVKAAAPLPSLADLVAVQ